MTRTHYEVKAERARKSWMHLKKQLSKKTNPEPKLKMETQKL